MVIERVTPAHDGLGRSRTGIEAASGTNTDSRSSETPPEPYDDSAKAEQPRLNATLRKTHSSFDVEQNLPKRRPERVEVGSVSSTVPEGVVDDGGATSTDALPEPTPAGSSSSSNALPEPTPARSSSSTSVPSSAANPLGSTRPIGVRLLVVILERSTRLDSPFRSGEGDFHSSMPCARTVREWVGRSAQRRPKPQARRAGRAVSGW
mmetsp:Transcript_26344/g.84705  ORF Transcript_26344/g.84705 Transcript_26344/m.84705 type:complete len:207 (-) Transcript_26344:328-948(-)